MNKKDYELIARVICSAPPKLVNRNYLMISFANELERDNPQFNRLKFMQACKLPVTAQQD